MQPNDSVHHEMMRLVSLSLRFRSRMAVVLSIELQGIDRINGIYRIGFFFILQILSVPLFCLRPESLQRRVQVAAKKNIEVFVAP